MADHRAQHDLPKPEITPRGRRLLRVALVIITIVVLIDAVTGEKGLLALMRAREVETAVAHNLESVRHENLRMVEQARRYREDATTIEELARRDLGLIKPGEKLFIIRDLPAAPRR